MSCVDIAPNVEGEHREQMQGVLDEDKLVEVPMRQSELDDEALY